MRTWRKGAFSRSPANESKMFVGHPSIASYIILLPIYKIRCNSEPLVPNCIILKTRLPQSSKRASSSALYDGIGPYSDWYPPGRAGSPKLSNVWLAQTAYKVTKERCNLHPSISSSITAFWVQAFIFSIDCN